MSDHTRAEKIANKCNVDWGVAFIEAFEKWQREYTGIKPVCWEFALAKFLCIKYNRYAKGTASVTFKPTEVKQNE